MKNKSRWLIQSVSGLLLTGSGLCLLFMKGSAGLLEMNGFGMEHSD